MRIVAISDTHGAENEIKLPEGDILIVAGDFSPMGTMQDVIRFNVWLGRQDFVYKILICGNHDIFVESDNGIARGLITEAIYLQDSDITLDGLKIYGSPWSPKFNDWSFMKQRGEQLKAVWDLIPSDTDILVTHAPPYGILDPCPPNGSSEGCSDLLRAVQRIKPKLHIFGHLHGGAGTKVVDSTTFINASVMDDDYNVVNQPVVIEL